MKNKVITYIAIAIISIAIMYTFTETVVLQNFEVVEYVDVESEEFEESSDTEIENLDIDTTETTPDEDVEAIVELEIDLDQAGEE